MSRATRLAKHIERTVTGPMWHGPALADVLSGVEAGRARRAADRRARTASGRWCCTSPPGREIARQRIQGEATGDPTPEQDWPPVSDADADWPRAIERLHETHRLLAAEARQLTTSSSTRSCPAWNTASPCCCTASSSTARITAARSRC